jgi:hypothetical protein
MAIKMLLLRIQHFPKFNYLFLIVEFNHALSFCCFGDDKYEPTCLAGWGTNTAPKVRALVTKSDNNQEKESESHKLAGPYHENSCQNTLGNLFPYNTKPTENKDIWELIAIVTMYVCSKLLVIARRFATPVEYG